MLAIQEDAAGNVVVLEHDAESKKFAPLTRQRWREIVSEELPLHETPRPIVPIQASIELGRHHTEVEEPT